MNWCRSCWQVTEPQKQVKQQAGLEASFSPTLKIAVPVTGLNGAHQYGGRLEKITPGMREEGLAGDTMKMEARREHLGPRVSRATCCACLGLTSPPLHTHDDGVCAMPWGAPSSLGHQLMPCTGTSKVQVSWVPLGLGARTADFTKNMMFKATSLCCFNHA